MTHNLPQDSDSSRSRPAAVRPLKANRRQLLGGATAAAAVGVTASLTGTTAQAGPPPAKDNGFSYPYRRWSRGPDPRGNLNYFPRAVWLQDPKNATKFLEAGINLNIGLWEGPTKDQLDQLGEAGLPTICEWNEEFIDRPEIVGWLLVDEPDIWIDRVDPDGNPYTGRMPASQVLHDYQVLSRKDPTRPVWTGLSTGLASQTWVGVGPGFNYEDHWTYGKAADVLSMDIYPIAQSKGPTWYPSKGVDMMRAIARPEAVLWSAIESGQINDPTTIPTPKQVVYEAWSCIIRGARGIEYFGHNFNPFDDHWWYNHEEWRTAIVALNRRIERLAPVLNQPNDTTVTQVFTENPEVLVDAMTKTYRGKTYIFAACMRSGQTRATFNLHGRFRKVTVLDEDRRLALHKGAFSDDFGTDDVHIYLVE